MENYQDVKDKFTLLLFAHEFCLEKEIDLPDGGKETHYESNNSRLILGYSQQENSIYTQIWLHSQWVTLQLDNHNSQVISFAERVQEMKKEAEELLLRSLL